MASPLSFSSPAPSPPLPTPAIDTLDHKFGRKGIKFSESTVELTVRNGSSLKLGTSNAHVSSYKPKVYWKDDGFEEVLYTLPGSRGGIGFVLNDADGDASSSSALEWTVHDVDSDSIDALQVELRSSRGSLDLTYVVSLYPESMATAVIVKNNGRKPVKLNTAILSHMRFKSRSGSGVQGLEGCSFCTHPPLSSPFEILSPREAVKPEEPQGWFNFGWEPEKKTGEWGVQEVPITVLRHKLSRVYAAAPQERGKAFHRSAPSKYEIIDQGLELMYRMIRMGFEEVYLSSPGSYSGSGSGSDRKDYFACTGPASILVPLTLQPNEEWRGAQIIEHDNL